MDTLAVAALAIPRSGLELIVRYLLVDNYTILRTGPLPGERLYKKCGSTR